MDAQEVEFSFISEERLRGVLSDYYLQARRALDARCYLGTIVGCGAVVEGLLTWALSTREEEALKSRNATKDRQGQVRPLAEWNLNNLIDVAVELQLMGRTAKQASWALKDFRNFIHPYNLLRQSARPDPALAMSSISAVLEIVRSLRGKIQP